MNKQVKIVGPEYYESLVARHSGDSIVVTDPEGLVVWSNEAFTRLAGYTLEEMQGHKPGGILQGELTCRTTVDQVRQALKHRRPIKTEILNYTKSGETYWIEMHITPIFDEAGRHTNFMSIERDITERKELEAKSLEIIQREKMREEESHLLSLISEWLYSAKSMDELLKVTKRSMETLFPESEGALYVYSNSRDTLDLAMFWQMEGAADRVKPDDCWALRRGRAYSYGTQPIEFTCEHVKDPDAPYFCLPILAHGETIGLLHLSFALPMDGDRLELGRYFEQRRSTAMICAEQISLAIANVRLRQELLDQSVRDPLTNLWNRRWMVDTMRREMAAAHEREASFSLVSLDIDFFKKFNDVHGHDAGDAVLRDAANEIVSATGNRGQACRAGGEEFAILCPELTPKQALEVAEDVRQAIGQLKIRSSGQMLPPVTASFGVAAFPDHAATPTDLLKAADLALYVAKDAGRNQSIVAGTKPTKNTNRKA